MMIRVAASMLLCVAASATHANAGCTAGSEFEPPLCPLELPAIRRIAITENAAKSAAEKDPAIRCDGFRLREAHVRRYLARAKTTTARAAHFTLDWSPCYAAGDVTFSDGRSGRWRIDQFRSGTLTLGDGEPVVLFCARCRFRPFAW
ncbi:hypothetical protein QTH89_05085 [Variovorax sp. J22G21]|uniref:hypothetical protein n=1 Tax=Variovorax fucosicus TaxID=3053517 RepID=UPI002578FC0A|nr:MULTISPECIES: hypothetical protein [unclassified Variovorax]MDM0041521.1 hypothetical protein [Variovorax sp. J22R193]MDM0060577.1 hypothetical protein [Variovorax sp. J22G21]